MIDDLSIRVLLDNTATRPELQSEHGLSLLLRWKGHVLLFDTGQTDRFVENAQALGEDLASVDLFVLSHGHYDHGGGLRALLDLYPHPPMVAHPHALLRRWSHKPGIAARSIGLADSVRQRSDLFDLHSRPTELAPGCTFLGAIPRNHPEGCGVRHLSLDPSGSEPDYVLDDTGIVLDTPHGLVIITGCCHAGVANYLDYVRLLWPSRPVRMLVGGLHLQAASDSELAAAVATLCGAGVEMVAPMHCTGTRGAEALAAADGFTVRRAETGSLLEC